MNSLKNKVAIITGSGRGLGKAIAERYAALGADIVRNYSRDKARQTRWKATSKLWVLR